MTALGERLVRSAKEARAIARGEMEPARVFVPPNIDARTIRRRLSLTQAAFSERFRIPLGTLRDWEQGRSRPDGAMRAYLIVIDRNPEAVQEALQVA